MENKIKSNSKNYIPPSLFWLFPYKIKKLPFSTNSPIFFYLFQNKVSLTIINWMFQGMIGMGKADLIGKICFEVIVLGIIFSIVAGSVFYKLFISFILAHTFNWIFNSHFWVLGRYIGLTRTNVERFPKYLKGIKNRMQNCSAIESIIVIGGASREKGVNITSDIDMFVIRNRGFLNGLNAILIITRERLLASIVKFPLDLYLYDKIETMEKHRGDEKAFILKDVHRLASDYYILKGRKVGGFDEYEKVAKTT